jgi:hypothetical protein
VHESIEGVAHHGYIYGQPIQIETIDRESLEPLVTTLTVLLHLNLAIAHHVIALGTNNQREQKEKLLKVVMLDEFVYISMASGDVDPC